MLVLLISLSVLIWTKLRENLEVIFWGTLMSVTYVIGFFIGINSLAGYIILFGALAVRLFLAEKKWNKESTVALFLAIPFLLTAAMPTRFLDAGTYYEQSARWFQNGIPRGIGNFDVFLMQSSMAHSNEALLNSLLAFGQNDLSDLISTLLIALAFSRIKNIGTPILILGALLFGVIVHFAQSSSSDLLLIALLVYAFVGRTASDRTSTELIFLMVILPFIKPVGAGISLLLYVEFYQKNRLKYAWILAIASLLYAGKLAWVSGWLPVVGPLPVGFSLPKEALTYLDFRQNFYEYQGRNQLPFNMDLLFGLPYLALLYYRFKLVKCRPKSWKLELMIHLIIVAFWALEYPAARYLLPFYVLLLAQMWWFTYQRKIQVKYVHAAFLICGLIAVLPPWGQWFADERLQRFFAFGGFENIGWMKPAALWQPETKTVVIDENFQVHIPLEPFTCFDAQFPCNPRLARYFNGDSVYLPKYNAEENWFSYQAFYVSKNGKAKELIDSLSVLPQFPLKLTQ